MGASHRPCTVHAIIIPSLQMGELRPRKVNLLAQDYIEFASKLSSLYAYLSHLAPLSQVCSTSGHWGYSDSLAHSFIQFRNAHELAVGSSPARSWDQTDESDLDLAFTSLLV